MRMVMLGTVFSICSDILSHLPSAEILKVQNANNCWKGLSRTSIMRTISRSVHLNLGCFKPVSNYKISCLILTLYNLFCLFFCFQSFLGYIKLPWETSVSPLICQVLFFLLILLILLCNLVNQIPFALQSLSLLPPLLT